MGTDNDDGFLNETEEALDTLDKHLTLLRKHNVSDCTFDESGQLIRVSFFRTLQATPLPIQSMSQVYHDTLKERPLSSDELIGMGENKAEQERQAIPKKRESDIDLAMNPPHDVRFPKDDGK